MIYEPMKVYHEVFLEDKKKKVTRFFIIPISGQEQQAIKLLNDAVNIHVTSTGITYNHFKEVGNQFVQLIVEGINN